MRNYHLSKGEVFIAAICFFLFMFRLWPLIILAVPIGLVMFVIRALFPKKAETIFGKQQEENITKNEIDCDEWAIRYEQAKEKISVLVQEKYPSAQWVWESSKWKSEFQSGADLYIRLNKEGGYKRVKVFMQDWYVRGIEIIESALPASDTTETKQVSKKTKDDSVRVAYEWVETHLLELNERCNEIIGQGNDELTLQASELPEERYWNAITQELIKAGLDQVEILSGEGIKIILK